MWTVEIAEDEVVPGGLSVFRSAAKTLLQDVDGMAGLGGQDLHEVTLGQTWEAGAQNCGMAGAQACEQFVIVHKLLLPIFPSAGGRGPNLHPLHATPPIGYDERDSTVITVRCQFRRSCREHCRQMVICGIENAEADQLILSGWLGTMQDINAKILLTLTAVQPTPQSILAALIVQVQLLPAPNGCSHAAVGSDIPPLRLQTDDRRRSPAAKP